MSRLAQAIAIRLLPVNSSAPATTTRIRPRLKERPPSRRAGPKPRSLPVITTRNRKAPSEMKAPASTESTNRVSASVRAFATPARATSCAISRGAWASVSGGVVSMRACYRARTGAPQAGIS